MPTHPAQQPQPRIHDAGFCRAEWSVERSARAALVCICDGQRWGRSDGPTPPPPPPPVHTVESASTLPLQPSTDGWARLSTPSASGWQGTPGTDQTLWFGRPGSTTPAAYVTPVGSAMFEPTAPSTWRAPAEQFHIHTPPRPAARVSCVVDVLGKHSTIESGAVDGIRADTTARN